MRKADEALVVIEPQVADYWPQKAEIKASDTIVLSRFAYLRRRGEDFVLKSPLAGALFRLCDAKIAAALAALCLPQKFSALSKRDDFAGPALLGLLLDCGILFKVDAAEKRPLRLAEGDSNLVFWDFHDLLFHSRSTEGRHVNPVGGVYPYKVFFRRCPPFGQAGRERRSICAKPIGAAPDRKDFSRAPFDPQL